MAQPPAQPPAAPPPPPPGAPASRPGMLTAAGIVLIVLGVIYAIFGIIVMIGGGAAVDLLGGSLGGAVIVVGLLVLAFGVLDVIAGIKAMGLSSGWRIAGIVLASIGALFAVLGVISSFSAETQFDFETGQFGTGGLSVSALITGLVFLAANVFVIVGLARTGRAVSR
ncbi:MAG: hypothetical protein ACRDI0_09815 [Actinomycetota bacterium]